MISLISVGIEKYENKREDSLKDIPCAYQDAQMVYTTFEKILGLSLKKYSSACLKDITSLECKALLSSLQLSIEEEEIFVFYFSGHGVTGSNGKLKLVFADYGYSARKGIVSIAEIVSILSNFHCKIVLILDCCYSGASLVESNEDDVKLENSISILASNRPISKAVYDGNGSRFTKALCEALEELYDLQEDITLNKIYEGIEKKQNSCQIVIGGGDADIVFSKCTKSSMPEDFAEKYINKIENSNYEMREAVWYALGYFPEPFKVNLIVQYRSKNEDAVAEMSWRVRRAIGSICRSNVTDSGKQLINKFLKSKNWMDRCIGYISAHKNPDISITQRMEHELQDSSNPMDLIWLVVLYLSERELKDERIVLGTNLLKTAWGATEIWKRYFRDVSSHQRMEIFESHMDVDTYKIFCLELYLRGDSDKINLCEYPEEVRTFIDVFKMLYLGRPRGRIVDSQINKWIFSVLYGNWRDQINLNKILELQLKTLRKEKKKKFLRALKYIPSIEIKMAVLDFFVTKLKEHTYSQYKNELQWALEDEHPWVVRTALPLFVGCEETVRGRLRKKIDMDIYPGVFDLAIELHKQGMKDIGFEIENTTDIEEAQLKKAIDNE